MEVQSKRSEVFCLYNLKKQAGVVYKRLFVQVAYLIGISLLAYGLFYWQKPVNLTEELDGGALFGIYCIAIPGTVLFWSVLSVTVSIAGMEQLNNVINKLQKIKNVISVERSGK